MLSRRATFALTALPFLPRDVRAAPPAQLDRKRIDHLLDTASVPGLQVATLRAGRLVEAGSFGRLRNDRDVPVTDTSLFEAASLTKPVFAVAVLELARRGRIDLDRPLHRDLALGDDARVQRVTPRHVLSHATGFPNWRRKQEAPLECEFEPGTQFRYSGEGFFLLQRVVERITGRSAASWVRELVLQPAGMTGATFDPSETAKLAWQHDARGRFDDEDGPPRIEKIRKAGPARPLETWLDEDRTANAAARGVPPLPVQMAPNLAAGLWVSAADYARFLGFARRYDELRQGVNALKARLAWSYGWGLEQAGNRQFAFHWGDNGGAKGFFLFDPARGDGIVILTNGVGGAKVYQRLVQDWAGRDFDALLWV